MSPHARTPERTEPEPPEAAALRALGCEHVFTDIDDDRRFDRPGLRAALDFLRLGDVLTVPALGHLGADVETVVRIVASLSQKGVTIRLGGMPMDMMIPTGEALAFACRALAQLTEPGPAPAVTSSGPRRRGRPQSLSNKDIAKAHRLLANGNAVPEVARALGVSPATVYRIFPRRPSKSGHPDDTAN
ncbi:recombinase family protein [Ancylobacter vacuolatus]|uniref:DNA invertase Pin-like site-specific DNA recombinase n=1 Tax=Ancylobacter vacuolatus TaxID=223389 RepID=A0ABU0DHQ7_9HYPH|nr:recombinase family protein [Ancylobacter vacuolatus]MDQ0347846.1 DNA invertase Pin-like site-specific DNA recombinase [Ancylobacter vacuolatus]